MRRIPRFLSAALIGCGLLVSTVAVAAQPAAPRNLAVEDGNLRLVVDFYERFFNQHYVQHAAAVVAPDYRQHNPGVPDGKAPFVEFFTGYFKEHPRSRARIVRSGSAGDLVFLHVHSTDGPADRGQAVVDIFRVQGGRIVEHWDVIQDVPAESANGNTMF